jgi:hypothetical protein
MTGNEELMLKAKIQLFNFLKNLIKKTGRANVN